MASFTIYDPKTKAFRALETASESDLPFEQVLLVNILIELRVISEYLQEADPDVVPLAVRDAPDDIRAGLVEEIGSVN